MTSKRVILAADGLGLERCIEILTRIGHRLNAVKIHDLADELGAAEVVRQLRSDGASTLRMMIDDKLHDIPKTVAKRTRALVGAGADIVTVHASGEIEMMMAAVENRQGAQVYAITALTSLDEEQAQLTYGHSAKADVLYLARMAKLAGVQGLVCSPKEVGMLAKRPELKGLNFIVPGIRSVGKEAGDQKRFDTPTAAIQAGATYLVVGSQLIDAPDIVVAMDELETEIALAGGDC